MAMNYRVKVNVNQFVNRDVDMDNVCLLKLVNVIRVLGSLQPQPVIRYVIPAVQMANVCLRASANVTMATN